MSGHPRDHQHESDSGTSFWGRLINPDKSPAPLLEQLCLGIAQLMFTFDDCGTTDLTPQRLAMFYQRVGGNYDTLFLETKTSALSFIYQSLGCFHSLQPSTNAFESPSIPALLPSGFVRWQTIQLLMDPDEHSQYLQNAVQLWDIENPCGDFFPKTIPRDAFPAEPDPEMVGWHVNVSRRLEYDYVKRQTPRSSPPDIRTFPSHPSPRERPPSEDHSRSRHRTRHRGRDEPPELPPRPRYHRQKSSDHPPSSMRRPQSAFFPIPEGLKSGFASPNAPSPPTSPPQRYPRPRGRERASSFAHPNPGSDASSENSTSGARGSSPPIRRSGWHRHLSPPRRPNARRHSHEAYARKAQREFSPDPSREHGQPETYASPSRRYDSDGGRRPPSRRYNDDLPHPTPLFREYIFEDSEPPPSNADPPLYPQVHARYVSGVNGNYLPRARPHIDPLVEEDSRRASYTGSIPSPGWSATSAGSERPRPASIAGLGARAPRWMQHPVQPTPAKRGVPIIPDGEYPPSGRRSNMYDR